MFCGKCGKKVESDAQYCEYCGAAIEKDKVSAKKKSKKNFWKTEKKNSFILKILFVADLFCFFAPFVKVTASGMAQVSTGLGLVQEILKGDFFDEVGNPMPELILIVTLMICGIALCFTFISNMTVEAGFTAGIAAACLVLFRITYIRYCNMYTYKYEEYGIVFTPKIQWGWTIALCILVISVLYVILLERGFFQNFSIGDVSFEKFDIETKIIKRYGIILLVFVIVAGGILHFKRNTIVGTWYAVGPDVLQMELSFTSDGRFSNGGSGGNYSAENGILILEWNPLYGTYSYEYEIKGSKLYIYNANHTYIYSRNESEQVMNLR